MSVQAPCLNAHTVPERSRMTRLWQRQLSANILQPSENVSENGDPMRSTYAVVMVLVCLMACSHATTALAEDAHASIFFKAVVVPDLQDAHTSTSFGALVFDFSKPVESAYAFTQEVHTTFVLGEKQMTQSLSGSGRLIVRSDGMELGEIALRDVRIKKPGHPEPVQMPPQAITHVRPDGTMANPGNALAEMIALLLPITGSDIVLGKSTKQPRRFPVHFQNQASEAVGERTITAKRHVLFKGKPCVLFTVQDSLLQLVPPIPEASVDMRGEGYSLYDYQAKSILVSKFAQRMRLLHFNEAKVDSDNYFSVDLIINPPTPGAPSGTP